MSPNINNRKQDSRKGYNNGGRRNNNKNSDKNKTVNDIIDKIEKIDRFSSLTPKVYADEDGYADKIAKNMKINKNQLRKFFGAVRDIEKKDKWEAIEPELYLLKPMFAVAVGRNNIPKEFFKLMSTCINKVDVGTDEEKLENFKTYVKFFEAIVAYNKYYEK